MKPCEYLLSAERGVYARLAISGPARREDIALLRRYVAALEIAYGNPDDPAPAPADLDEDLKPGDLVQLRPSADRTFGGLSLRVCRVNPYEVRGYLLVPHRGGHREAWLPWRPCDVARIGSLHYPEAEWGFRDGDAHQRRMMWSDL